MGIYLKEVYYCYGAKHVLNNIHLVVQEGEHIGIIGASGGGKSTLLKLISGLYELQTGQMTVAGEEKPYKIRRKVAMVLQSSPLFPVSIRDNITCGHEMKAEKVWQACRAAQLTEWLDTLPEGLDTNVGERGSKVSGGQAQRISIARAIARDAPVVLLDEATSALDSDTGNALLQALKELTKGKTVIHVTHRQEVLFDCDRIYQLTDGKMTEKRYNGVTIQPVHQKLS